MHVPLCSVQYLENKWTEFHQFFYMHSYWKDLRWDCYTSVFAHFYQSYGPWYTPKFHFRSLSWEQINRISLNFIYAFILTRSTLGVMALDFFSQICKRVMALDWCQNYVTTQYSEKLRPFTACLALQRGFIQILWQFWIMPKFRFRSISWEKFDRNSPNYICGFVLTRSSLGLLHVIFCTFVTELWPSFYDKISFPLNILRTNWQNFNKFNICLYIDINCDSCGQWFHIYCQSFGQDRYETIWAAKYSQNLLAMSHLDKIGRLIPVVVECLYS